MPKTGLFHWYCCLREPIYWILIGFALPGGVIGNTRGFDPRIPGSSPGRVSVQRTLLFRGVKAIVIDKVFFTKPGFSDLFCNTLVKLSFTRKWESRI